MILSALATSVGLNLALTVLLAAAYSLLRSRPSYVEVYAPRRPYAPLEPWLAAAWRRSEEDVHAAAGLDGVVFVRIFVFRFVGPSRLANPHYSSVLPRLGPFPCSLECACATLLGWCSIRVFAAAAVLGVGVLLPVNFLGHQLQEIDFTDLPNKSIDLFSVSNVQDGSGM